MDNKFDAMVCARIFKDVNKMTHQETHTLLLELIGVYLSGNKSILMNYLINNNFTAFKGHVRYMNDVGDKIKNGSQ